MRFNYNYLTATIKTALGVSISLLCLILSGCTEWAQPEKPCFVVVLVDETDSFKLRTAQGKEIMFWSEAISRVLRVVNRLQPGDKFTLMGIDEHGFDADDVRIPIKTLDEGVLKAEQEKMEIAQQVKKLQRRKEIYKATDILGALYHAAYFLNKQDTHHGIIFIFSDMLQYPKFPSSKEAAELNFPDETKCYCFYVSTSGRENWQRLVNIWLPILNNAGLKITDKEFFQRSEEVAGVLNTIWQ